jgi:4-amino-4-deoxy-L-arabinose transferase-like glycosyltransferase
LTLGAFALRVHGLGRQSFWLDEVDAIAMAGAPLAAQLRKLTAIGENGPLYFLLFKGWLSVAGTSEFGARALSALASTAAVPLLGVLGLRLFRHRPTALIAAALGAVSPYYVWYAQDAKMYPTFAALALGAQYAFLRAWEAPAGGVAGEAGHGGVRRARAGWWAAYVLCSSFALYVHLFAALQIAANTVAGLWLWPRRPAGRRGFCVATGLLVLPYLPLAVWQAPVLLEGRNVGYRPTPLPAIAVALLEQLTWHLNPPPNRRLLLLLGGALLWGLYRSGRRAPLLAIWLLVPVALTVLLQGTVPVFRDRYLIPLLVPLLLLLARAMAPPWTQHHPSGGPAVGEAPTGNLLGPVVAVFVAAGFGYGLLNRPPNPDFRAAAALVHAQAGPGDSVGFLAGYAERPFDYYYRQRPGSYEKVQLPYTNAAGLSESDGLRAVATSLRDGRGLWVVRFEDWLWDERDLTGRYLEGRGAREVLRRDFDGVSVSRYELSRPATG